MSLVAIGLNHNTAPIDIREKLSFSIEQATAALANILQNQLAKEVVVFSTCNRTELYFADLVDENEIYKWLANTQQIDINLLISHTYCLKNDNVSKHLFRVATGLDSIALGEPQILGQVKAAYQLAQQHNATAQTLNKLFQEAFYVAKNIRTTTKLGENSISIAYAAVKLSERFFSNYNDATALIIGAGETSTLAAKTLHKKGLGKIIIANRTIEKAQNLALELNGYAIMFEQIADHIHEADIIVSATNKNDYTIDAAMIKNTIHKRRQRTQLFLDLAVPRDIDPSIKTIGNSYLYSVDDLDEIIKNNKELRQQAADEAEKLVLEYNKNFSDWISLRKNHSLLKQLHENSQLEKDKLLDEALRQLSFADDDSKRSDILSTLATKLTKKLTHQPSLLIRKACEDNDKALIDNIIDIYKFKK